MSTRREVRYELEILEGWGKDFSELPRLKFDADWEVSIMPPFGGATARFVVYKGERRVSVYMDHFDALGSVGVPYYEIYPDKDGDTARFYLTEVKEMMDEIRLSLDI